MNQHKKTYLKKLRLLLNQVILIMTKKAQAALEYLMTYGWAILIIAIIAGALYYMNVFSSSCDSPISTGFSGVEILSNDFAFTSEGDLEIILTNAAAETVHILNVTVQNGTSTDVANTTALTLDAGTTITYTFSGLTSPGSKGSCYTEDVAIYYTRGDLSTIFKSTGSLRHAVQ